LFEISGAVKENGVLRIRINQEVMDVSSEPDIVSEIRKTVSRRLGYVERLSDVRKF